MNIEITFSQPDSLSFSFSNPKSCFYHESVNNDKVLLLSAPVCGKQTFNSLHVKNDFQKSGISVGSKVQPVFF